MDSATGAKNVHRVGFFDAERHMMLNFAKLCFTALTLLAYVVPFFNKVRDAKRISMYPIGQGCCALENAATVL